MTRNRKRATRPDAQATARLPWVAATLAAALLLGGCPSQPVKAPPESEASTQPPAGDVGTAAVADRGLPPELNDPSSPLYQRVIYFDYDSSDIQPQFVEVLRAHALFLSTSPNRTITLEGHTDERGTREYNLALADQRAETVRRFLLAEGVARGQLNTLSYGEERPAQPGRDEESWALNRRVELLY